MKLWWSEKKIALVKQNVYQDLYVTNSKSPREIIDSSIRRCGPVGLLVDCKAHFFIVNVKDNQECNVWKQKFYDCKQEPISFYQNFANERMNVGGKSISQKELSVDIEDIRWGEYDIVISIDVCFPSSFTKLYPKVLWCYMPGEPCMKIYSKSILKILDGYDVFLNQELPYYPITYRDWLRIPFYRSFNLPFYTPKKWKPSKEIQLDFPYTLSRFDSIERIYSKNQTKTGIAFEFYSYKQLNVSCLMQDKKLQILKDGMSKKMERRLVSLTQTKYFVTDSDQYKRGNGLVEAMSAGCLCLSTKGQYLKNYQKLMGDLGSFNNIDEIFEFIEWLENDSEKFSHHKSEQDKRVNYRCFELPLKRLFELHDYKLQIE